jgi:hypothetical protein
MAIDDDRSEAPDPELLRILDGADEEDLAFVDVALDAAATATSRESALAALATATQGLNSVAGRDVTARSIQVTPALSGVPVDTAVYMHIPHLPLRRGKGSIGPGTDQTTKMQKLIEKYFAAAETIVKKYGAAEYQISLGFPQLVSITFIWRVTSKSG